MLAIPVQKDVLLHNTNIHPPIPVAHSVTLKEYENLKLLLESVQVCMSFMVCVRGF